MTDNKLTDNEIIKALKKHSMDLCSNCKVEKTTLCNNCISEIERNALDLINRQQAEIEKLTEKTNAYAVNLTIATSAIHSLKADIKTTKVDAIKECLEKIEQMDVSESDEYIAVKKYRFNNLVKEMVGDAE